MIKTPIKKAAKRGALVVVAFSILTRILSFLFKIYLSRRVGAETLGIFQMCVSVFLLFSTIAASGIPLILSRKTAELSATGSKRELDATVTAAAIFSLGTALVTILLALLFHRALPALFSDERCVPLFYIMLPALVSTVTYQLVRGYLMGKRRYTEYSFTELFEEVVKIIACVTFLSGVFSAITDDLALAIAFTVTDYIVMAFLLVLYCSKGGRLARPRGMRSLIGAGTPITLMRIAAGLLSSFIAIALPAALIRSGLTAGEAAAEYGRAVGMAFSLLFAPLSVTGALSVIILPEAAALAAQGRWKELRGRVDDSIILIFIITVLFYALYMALGEPLGILLFKDAGAGRFIAFSAGMVVPMALSGFINTTLNSIGEEKKVFLSFLVSAALLVVEILVLPRYIGIYALSVAACSFYTVQFVFGLVLLLKKKACGAVFRPAALTMFSAFPVAFIMKAVARVCAMFTDSLLLATFPAAAMGSGAYILLLLLFRPAPRISAILCRLRRKKKPSVKPPAASRLLRRSNAVK